MDKNKARAMKDQHSRDEARMRQQQQRSAGTGHAPVEAWPQHGAQSATGGWRSGPYVADYEGAIAREAAAWDRVKTAADETAFLAAWDDWRGAVEDRDKATRLLINQSL